MAYAMPLREAAAHAAALAAVAAYSCLRRPRSASSWRRGAAPRIGGATCPPGRVRGQALSRKAAAEDDVAPVESQEQEEEEERAFMEQLGAIKDLNDKQGNPVRMVGAQDRTPEEEAELQELALNIARSQGIDVSEITTVKVIELENAAPMKDDPALKYKTQKDEAVDALARGDIHLVETASEELLASRPDDVEVWRALVASRLRLNLYEEALQSARRWIEHDPYAVLPRNAEAFALAGCHRFGEARARFGQLAIEVQDLDAEMADDLRDCVRRIDELWIEHEPGQAKLSMRPAQIILGSRPPEFYLPNFADSVGPVRVASTSAEELGGGHSHSRKLVVTRDVVAGDLLFVQNPLVFGIIEREGHVQRLGDAMVVKATCSPRAAMLVSLLADDGPLDEENNVVATIADPEIKRSEGPLSKEPLDVKDHLETCQKIVDRSRLLTGRSFAGVWTLPAMARHSCLPTANYVCFGDALIARAATDMRAGDEVTFATFDVLTPLEERRQAALDNGGSFWCRCPRCEQEEEGFGSKVAQASAAARKRFEIQSGRVRAVRMQLQIQLDSRDKQRQKHFEGWDNQKKMEYNQIARGLADKYRNLNGKRIDDEDMEVLRESLPEEVDIVPVEVPEDLEEDLNAAITEFEDAIAASGLSEKHQRWCLASHFQLYSDVLMIASVKRDVRTQRRLLSKLVPAVGALAPGSFIHQRLTSLSWQVSIDGSQDALTAAEAGAAELEAAFQSLRLRYGMDLSSVECEAALARVMMTHEIDENNFWEVGWCIGATPEERALQEADEEAEPDLSSLPSASALNA